MQVQQNKMPESRLALTTREAATAIGISERLLWSLTKSGEIPSRRIGRRVVYPVHLLKEWLENSNT